LNTPSLILLRVQTVHLKTFILDTLRIVHGHSHVACQRLEHFDLGAREGVQLMVRCSKNT